MRKIAISAALLVAAVNAANAQNQFNRRQTEDAVAALAEAGASCETILRTRSLGQLNSRDVIIAVECMERTRYVILLDRRGRMTFFATCEAFEEANRGTFCFR